MRWLVFALILTSPVLAQSPDLSGAKVIPNGSTVGPTLATRFAQRLNIRDGCGAAGAVGDGVADDSPAIAACESLALTKAAAGTPVVVYFPGGNYLVKGTQLPVLTRGTSLIGDGMHQSWITIDPTYAGDLFPYSEARMNSAWGTFPLVPSTDLAGPTISGLMITGTKGAAAQQNAFMFYDRVDHVYMSDVTIAGLNGRAIAGGIVKNVAGHAYIRESDFWNVKVWNAGTASIPAVEITSVFTAGDDFSNSLSFHGLNVFNSTGPGVIIHNTRLANFYQLRVEQSGGDNTDIGLAADTIQTSNVRIYGFNSISPGSANTGFAALAVSGTSLAPYGIEVYGGHLGPCLATTCNGLVLNNVTQSTFHINTSSTTTNVITGAGLGVNVLIDGAGTEPTWVWSANAGSAGNIHTPVFKSGNPATGGLNTVAYTATSGTITQIAGTTSLSLDLWSPGGTGGNGPSLSAATSGSGGAGGGGGMHNHWGPFPWASLGATSCTYSIAAVGAAQATGGAASVTCNGKIVAQAGGGGGGGNGSAGATSGGGGGSAANASGGGGTTTGGGGTGGTGGAAGGTGIAGSAGGGDAGGSGAGSSAVGVATNGGGSATGAGGGGSGGGCNGAAAAAGSSGGANQVGAGGAAGVAGTSANAAASPGGGGSASSTGVAAAGGAGGFPGGGGGGGGAGCNGTGTGGTGGLGGAGQIVASQW